MNLCQNILVPGGGKNPESTGRVVGIGRGPTASGGRVISSGGIPQHIGRSKRARRGHDWRAEDSRGDNTALHPASLEKSTSAREFSAEGELTLTKERKENGK